MIIEFWEFYAEGFQGRGLNQSLQKLLGIALILYFQIPYTTAGRFTYGCVVRQIITLVILSLAVFTPFLSFVIYRPDQGEIFILAFFSSL